MTRGSAQGRRPAPPGLLLLIAVTSLTSACKRADPVAPYPHESMLGALAELKVFLRQDPYRDPPGMDLEGRNIYRVTLERITALDEVLGPEYDDILAFARAECDERIGLWQNAARQFALAAAGPDGPLAERAAAREQWARQIAEILGETTGVRSLEEFASSLEERGVKLAELGKGDLPHPYSGFIPALAEENLRRSTTFYFSARMVMSGAAEKALARAETLVREHEASHRQGENLILLGQLHEGLALDYVRLQPPAQAGFEAARFSAWTEKAREAYARAASLDGDPAKPEAQARLRALDALSGRTLGTGR